MSTVSAPAQASTRAPVEHGAYRAWLSTEAGSDWVERAVDQVSAWLRGKDRRLDIDLGQDATHVVAGKTITVRRHRKGGQVAFRFTMVEGPVGRRYTTTVMFIGGRTGGWMSLQGTNDAGRWVETPNLATNLLESPGAFTDGGRVVSPELWHVRGGGDRAALLDLLVSDRRGAVFVAAAGHQAPELATDFARKVEQWTQGARGLSHVVFLDADSAAWLRNQVGGALGVAEWTVRTFRPGIDLGSPIIPASAPHDGSASLDRHERAPAAAPVLEVRTTAARRAARTGRGHRLATHVRAPGLSRGHGRPAPGR